MGRKPLGDAAMIAHNTGEGIAPGCVSLPAPPPDLLALDLDAEEITARIVTSVPPERTGWPRRSTNSC